MISSVRLTSSEISGKQTPQVAIDSWLYNNRLPQPATTNTYATYRAIRKDSTIALVRELTPGPILASNWNIEGAEDQVPEERVKFIRKDMLRIRDTFLLQAVRGLMDFGWMPFEKVWEKDEKGFIHLKKLKPLLHDYTWILVDKHGGFLGFQQNDLHQTVIPLRKALLLSQDVEGTNWYGEGKLEIASKPVADWDDSNEGANRYDKKIAGSHWVVYYPIGETELNGVMTDNFEIAKTMLNNLESSGKMALPQSFQTHILDMNQKQDGWKVETLSDSVARQFSFVKRLEYLDKLKVRAYGFPDKAILEGKFAPNNEAGVHANITATALDVRHNYIVHMLNLHIVDPTLRYNWGKEAEETVRINPAPITNMSLGFLQDVYKMMLNNQQAVGYEYNSVDMAELRDKIAIPHDGSHDELETSIPVKGQSKTVEDALEPGSFKADGGVQS